MQRFYQRMHETQKEPKAKQSTKQDVHHSSRVDDALKIYQDMSRQEDKKQKAKELRNGSRRVVFKCQATRNHAHLLLHYKRTTTITAKLKFRN